jgi:NADPH:quinone reductase-like Zn-dependent oxidoreductase
LLARNAAKARAPFGDGEGAFQAQPTLTELRTPREDRATLCDILRDNPADRLERHDPKLGSAPDQRQRGIADLSEWLEGGQIRHEIAARFPLERVAEAHEAVEQGGLIGNVVISV